MKRLSSIVYRQKNLSEIIWVKLWNLFSKNLLLMGISTSSRSQVFLHPLLEDQPLSSNRLTFSLIQLGSKQKNSIYSEQTGIMQWQVQDSSFVWSIHGDHVTVKVCTGHMHWYLATKHVPHYRLSQVLSVQMSPPTNISAMQDKRPTIQCKWSVDSAFTVLQLHRFQAEFQVSQVGSWLSSEVTRHVALCRSGKVQKNQTGREHIQAARKEARKGKS